MQILNRSSIRKNGHRPRWESNGLRVLLKRMQSEINRPSGGSVVAFTSANPGEGVSFVVRSFAERIAQQTGKRTVVIEAGRLRKLRVADLIELSNRPGRSDLRNLWLVPHESNGSGQKRRPELQLPTDSDWVSDSINALRTTFDYILIDCPSLSTSFEAEALAPEVDGVVMVVEADRTKRDQILRAKKAIELASGKVVAMTLNKQRHVVPGWLYRRL